MTTQECQGKADLDPCGVLCQDITALLEICADINSNYLEFLQKKNIQFCRDTANICSPFIEIFRGGFSATEYPMKSKVDIMSY